LYKDIRVVIITLSHVPHYIRTDDTRLQQILMNYLGNAIKFTSTGTIQVRVGFKKDRLQSNVGKLEIEVKDTGCGISEDDQKQLFSPFTKLSASRNLNPNGTGLGLSICKRIAESLGGSVWVRA